MEAHRAPFRGTVVFIGPFLGFHVSFQEYIISIHLVVHAPFSLPPSKGDMGLYPFEGGPGITYIGVSSGVGFGA